MKISNGPRGGRKFTKVVRALTQIGNHWRRLMAILILNRFYKAHVCLPCSKLFNIVRKKSSSFSEKQLGYDLESTTVSFEKK